MPFSETIAYLLDIKYASYAMAGRDANCKTASDTGHPPEGYTNTPFTPLEHAV